MTDRFAPLRDAFPHRRRPLLMTALVAGDPHLGATREFMNALIEGGADVLELVLPFSDPTFHGPVMRRACERALREHVGWEGIAEIVADFRREETEIPIVLTSYYNRVLHIGVQECVDRLAEAGVDGLLVMDLPAEDADEVKAMLEARQMSLIQVVAPTTEEKRFRRIARDARGVLVWTGHCGSDIAEPDLASERIQHLRKLSPIPLVASMSVESGEDAARVAESAHGVLVGSSLAWLIEGGADVTDRLRAFVAELRIHLDRQ
jgi:tryptophan synthase alpha chain